MPHIHKVLEKFKAELDINDHEKGFDYTIDAPDGYDWIATGCSVICGSYHKGQEKISECYARMIEDIEKGLTETL